MSSPSSSDLAIGELLAKKQTYDTISSTLHVSPKRIAQVRRLMEAGSITLDKEGKANYAPDYRPGTVTEDYSTYAYRAARILGVEDPAEALETLLAFAVKLNPYLLYYGVKKPEDLVGYFRGRIATLQKEVEGYKARVKELDTMDEFELAERMGLDERVFNTYREIQRKGFHGSLGEFLNQAICLHEYDVATVQ